MKKKNEPIRTIGLVSSDGSWVALSALSRIQQKYCATILRLGMLEEAFAGRAVFQAYNLLRSNPAHEETENNVR
ncbi:MAG: hypothetical protein GX111_04920 [Clostridiales bacterium]|jgi:hypothetical protein|nr:hypothetical protein [Clostridiales bacterium]